MAFGFLCISVAFFSTNRKMFNIFEKANISFLIKKQKEIYQI